MITTQVKGFEKQKESIDLIQNSLDCCGPKNSSWWLTQRDSYPPSCYRSGVKRERFKQTTDAPILKTEGCDFKIQETLKFYLSISMIAAIICSVTQCVVFLFSIFAWCGAQFL